MSKWIEKQIEDFFDYTVPGDWGTEPSLDDATAVIGTANFRNDGKIDFGNTTFRKIEKSRLEKRRINSGDILIEKSGGSTDQLAGRVVYCDIDFGGTCSNFVEVAKVKSEFDNRFIFYLLFYLYRIGRVAKYQQQTTGIINFKLNEYKQEQVRLPESKAEQSAIARVLLNIDKTIERIEELIAKQQGIKRGLLQDLLTKGIDEHGAIRSEATHEFKDSLLGRVPKEWVVEDIGNFLLKSKGFIQTGPFGSQLHAHEYVHNGVPVIMPQDMLGDEISVTNIARVTEEKANQLRRHKTQINDVVFSRRGDLSRVVAINDKTSGWLCGTGCLLMRVGKERLNAKWFASIYRSHLTQTQVAAMAVGSTMPNLNGTIISQLLVAFPSLKEQEKIASIFTAKENEIGSLIRLKGKFESLKNGLMQDLLTEKSE